MPTIKPTETRAAMAEGVAKAPEGSRPWEDRTLSATERYDSYDKVLREHVEGVVAAMTRAGITEGERTAIRLSHETEHWVSELKQLRSETPKEFCLRIDDGVAGQMVDSYTFDKETGVSTVTIPAGVTDVEAMKALNEYFRKHLPSFNRDAVYAEHLEQLEKLPKEYPEYCQERDYSQAREITITGVVKGTKGETRATQKGVLKKESLVFADPRDQALAAAIHACKHGGEDLFKNMFVRGSVPGFALFTFQINGVFVNGYYVDFVNSDVAASGSPSPESK